MEKHCVSLELSKQLKEAGWKKETESWWVHHTGLGIDENCQPIIPKDYGWTIHNTSCGNKDSLPAPLATELLEDISDTGIHIYLMHKYGIATAQSCLDLLRDIDELGRCWIFLVKQGIIKP